MASRVADRGVGYGNGGGDGDGILWCWKKSFEVAIFWILFTSNESV